MSAVKERVIMPKYGSQCPQQSEAIMANVTFVHVMNSKGSQGMHAVHFCILVQWKKTVELLMVCHVMQQMDATLPPFENGSQTTNHMYRYETDGAMH